MKAGDSTTRNTSGKWNVDSDCRPPPCLAFHPPPSHSLTTSHLDGLAGPPMVASEEWFGSPLFEPITADGLGSVDAKVK